jgi:hypothetical protein
MPTLLDEFLASEHSAPDRVRTPKPFGGWALERATALDRAGAHGLVADLLTSSVLTRQAAFLVLAMVSLDDPRPFLTRLGHPPGGIGDAIRTRLARDLIAAALDVAPTCVPGGYLRALMRIKEPNLGDPLGCQDGYRRMWEILVTGKHSAKAHALRYCGPISAATLQVLDFLDPVLVHPDLVKHLYSVPQAHKANDLMRLLRGVISTWTDQEFARTLRQSVSGGSPLETFARKAIEKADRFPPPPFLPAEGIQPLTSAAELIAFGREMGNCSAKKIAEVLLRLSCLYRVEQQTKDGGTMVLAVELVPLSNGLWLIQEIKAAKNERPPTPVLRAVLERLHALGAMSSGAPQVFERTKALAGLLGVYRYEPFDLALLETEPEAA